ncbi:MAG TPA: ATP synthase F1 subunit gamma [Candidatus Saccharimonadales bacterium]|nr:ATP synthase F1 subunit gamma [Candidatus Saccharimonadales bacterium]
MASVQQIKRRITSVKSTRQITKAMQLVAASKLRRAQTAAEQPRVYSETARHLLAQLKQQTDQNAHAFFKERPIKNRTLIVITSDRGLAGAYNSNVLKKLVEQLKKDSASGVKTKLFLVGRQAAKFVARLKDIEVSGVFQDVTEAAHRNELRALISGAFDAFNADQTDSVEIVYTHFISTVTQQVRIKQLLPITKPETEEKFTPIEFEPSVGFVLDQTVLRLIEVQVFQAMLDGFASEHSMRMLAMKNATDNAGELADDLTLVYNNARQAGITQELAEITGGAEAMK